MSSGIATADDILAGFKALWDDSALPSLVAGGLHHGRPTEDTGNGAYAVLKVEEGKATLFSTGNVKPFTVKLSVYSPRGNPCTLAIQQDVRALYTLTSQLAIAHGTVLHCIPQGGSLEVDADKRDANNVLVAGAMWEVLTQGE